MCKFFILKKKVKSLVRYYSHGIGGRKLGKEEIKPLLVYDYKNNCKD